MNKYILSLATIFGLVICCSSCRMNVLKGGGNKTTSNPAVSSFSAIVIDISLKSVIDVQGNSQPGVQFSGYENLLKHIKTKVENNTLRIYSDLDDTWTMDCADVTAHITIPALTALTLTGAPDADVHGTVAGSNFKLDISGAGDVKIDNVALDNFSIDVSGAGDVDVNGGAAKHLEYEISGAGGLKAYPLQANEVVATISGAGTSEVTALQKLDASISGAGTIKYKGHPVVSQEVSGVGTISEAN